MGVVFAVNVLRELADEQRGALARTLHALEILEGGEVAADEVATSTLEVKPDAAPAVVIAPPTSAPSKRRVVRAGTPDYDAIARLVNNRAPTQSMKEAILAVHDVPDSTVGNWLQRMRERGMIGNTAMLATAAPLPPATDPNPKVWTPERAREALGQTA